ncbi:MAG: Efflux transporter, family, subunit [Verrucomicrobiales bacterium]|nr:Efflux transporter, family, subunit [Verrucomicrobiales bacterium]
MKNLLVAFILIAVLGAGGYYFWTDYQKKHPAVAVASRTTTATVSARDINFAVTAAGDIGPADQVSVRPEVSGKIENLPVDVGDIVKKGDILFTLDDADLQIEKASVKTEIEGAKLQIEAAKLRVDNVRRSFERNQELFKSKLISGEQFDTAKTDFSLATNAVEISRNNLEKSEKTLEQTMDRLTKTKILAPFDCTILTRPVSVGQAVSGSGGVNSGTEVLTIANLNEMIINCHINQADVTRLKQGQEVDIEVEAVPGLKMKGVVDRLAPQATIKNQIKGFATRIVLKKPDSRVRPGMTANISIPLISAENVLAVPLAAVFTDRGEHYVYVKDGETFKRREIQIGVADYDFVEVKGLNDGEIVTLEKVDEGSSGKLPTPIGMKAKKSASDKKSASAGKTNALQNATQFSSSNTLNKIKP